MFSGAWLRVLVGALPVAAAVGACTNDARDAHCTPDEPDKAARPDCIYASDGLGPEVKEDACPRVSGDAPATCPTFDDVMAILVDAERGACMAGGCHGVADSAALGIHLPSNDPDELFDALTTIEGTVGRPYVDADDPPASWMVCNLRGERGGGYPMPIPYGLPDLADADVVRDWILCGAEPPPTCAADMADGACATCGKDRCCQAITSCLADMTCPACAACIQTADPAACAASCDRQNAAIDGLLTCLVGRCGADCPTEMMP